VSKCSSSFVTAVNRKWREFVVQLYKLRVWSCAVVEMCMCVFKKDVMWIVGVLWDHLGKYGNIRFFVFTSCNNSFCELVALLLKVLLEVLFCNGVLRRKLWL
jgi:hypothetical protein